MAKKRDVVKEIRKATRRKFSAEEKIRVAAGKVSLPISTTAGPRRFWRLERTVSPVTPSATSPRMK